jgi:hypothetical protein
MKNNLSEKDRDNIYNIIKKVMKLLDNFLGLTKNDAKFLINEKNLNCLDFIKNEKLNLKDPIFLVSDNFQYVFLKYIKKLDNII